MEAPLASLTETLEMEAQVYQGLIKLALEKRNALEKGDLNHLESITGAENLLLRRAAALSRQREGLSADAPEKQKPDSVSAEESPEAETGRKGALPGNQNRGTAADQMPWAEADPPSADAMARLARLAEELRQINQLNGEMIRHLLDYVNFSLGLALGETSAEGYYQTGKSSGLKVGRKLNRWL